MAVTRTRGSGKGWTTSVRAHMMSAREVAMKSTLCFPTGLALLASVAAACGTSSTSATGAGDAGTAVDAHAPVDAGVEADAPTLPPACSETAARTRPVTIIVMPDAGEAPFVASLTRATKSVHMMVYDLEDGGILTTLLQKAKAGLDVKVILDQSEQPNDQPAFDALTAAGAKVEWSSTQFTYMHAKTFVVDGLEAVVSSGNFAASQMQVERNYAAVDDDPQDVAVLAALFDADWARATPDVSCTRLLVAPVNAAARLASLVQAAKKSVYVESMEFADADVTAAILAQTKAGLDVRVLLADAGFVPENSSNYTYLKSMGVPGRWLADPVLHVKSIIIDGNRAYFGSENLSYTSLHDNREVGLEVLTSDGENVAAMTSTFEADWAKATPD